MTPEGFRLYPAFSTPRRQRRLVAEVLGGDVTDAPFYRPVTPGGQPMSVEMTNLGPLGWITDAAGYRYEATPPGDRPALAADAAGAARACGPN